MQARESVETENILDVKKKKTDSNLRFQSGRAAFRFVMLCLPLLESTESGG